MYIDRIVIDPLYHGLGLGRVFYIDLIDYSRHVAHIITCEVNLKPKNKETLILHEKF